MENSDLYLILKTLTANELNELFSFAQIDFIAKGRYRNQSKILLEMLREHILAEKKSDFDKETVFQKLFPDQTVSVGQIERVMHELLQIVRQFLLFRDYFSEANDLNRQIRFATILRSRGLENKAMIQINQVSKQLSDIVVKGTKHYRTKFDASWLHYSISSQNTKWKDDLQIPTVIAHLDHFYYSQKLSLINHYLVLNAVSRIGNAVEGLPENMIVSINPDYLSSESYILISYKIYSLLSQPMQTKEGFEELLALLNRYEPEMDKETVSMSYGFLRNYCIFLIRAGHYEMNAPLFSIMIDNLQKGYFYYEGKLALGSYQNIANVALRVGAFDWAYQFTHEHKNLTFGTEEEKDETYHLIMAQYYHGKKDFDTAITFLPQNSHNLQRLLSIKTLEIMIYYDQNADLFQHKLDAFKMFINRSSKKTISDENGERHANFINFMAQIGNSAPGDVARANKIIGRIKAKDHVAEKEWLLKKAEEIMRQ